MILNPYRVVAENVGALLVTPILSTDAAPFAITITTGAGASFPSTGDFLVTLAAANETETSAVETFKVSGRTGDTLQISARALGGTTAANWIAGSKVQMRISALHLQEIQEALTDTRSPNTFFAGPASGPDTAPDFRAITADDIPDLDDLNGTLDVAGGGTGRTSLSSNNLLVGNGTGQIGFIAPGAVGDILYSDGTQWLAGPNPGGETNTVSNVGTAGVGVYKQKTGVDFEMRNINAASAKVTVTLDAGNNEIDIDVSESNLTLSNMGGTVPVTKGGTGFTSVASGDILFASATNTLSTLAGNSTTTQKFLGQSGDGVTPGDPAWVDLQSTDIPPHEHSGDDITSGSLGVDVGGTNLTTYVPGDMLYASATQVLSTVAGNTTVTRKFLTQTGTGAISAAPLWNTIQPTDMPEFGPSGSGHARGAVPDPGAAAGTTRFLCEDGTWTTVTAASGGTVTSVDITLPADFAVAGNPITTTGTLAITYASQSQNLVFASPDGAPGTPGFRSLVSADIPNLSAAKITSGTLAVARGGTNSSAALNNNRIMVSSGGAIVEAGAMTDGQLLIGDTGSSPVVAALTAGAGIVITNAAGSITIEATAGGAPAGAEYVVLALDGTLTDERVLTGTANRITLTDGGAGGNITLDIGTDVVTLTGTQSLTNKTLLDSTTFFADNGDVTKILQFQLSGLTTATTRTWTVPDVNGTVVTTGNLAAIIATGTIASGVWNGTAITEAYGGTGLSTYTLGDILYSDASNSLAALAGSTSATKMFLTQTGTGAVSAAPAWGPIAAGDIASGTLGVTRGGTGLAALGAANYVLGVNNAGNANEYKQLVAGTGISVTHGAGSITIDNTGSGGTVTSVDLAMPSSEFNISGNPVTTSGTLTVTWDNQTQNKVLASPDGSTGTPGFRALVSDDIPSLSTAKLTTGTLGVTRGGTGLNSFSTGDILYASASNTLSALAGNTTTAQMFLAQTGTGAASQAPGWVSLVAADIPNLNTSKLTAGTLPIARGGTGVASTPANGELLIGDGAGFTLATLTAGTNITINNTAGGIEIVASGAGGVSSVDLTMPTSEFSVSGNPITGAGTLTVTWDSQAQNLVLASPDGSSGAPSFRALTSGDIPDLSAAKITSGTFAQAIGATLTNATTNTATDVVFTLGHNSSGTPLAGFGSRMEMQLKSSTTADRPAAYMQWDWQDPADAGRDSRLRFYAVINGTATEYITLGGTTATNGVAFPSLGSGIMYVSGGSGVLTASTNNNTVLYTNGSGVVTSSTSNLTFDATNFRLGISQSSPAYKLHIDYNATSTNTVEDMIGLDRNSTGTAANGIGAGILFRIKSSTTTDQDAGRVSVVLDDATHASLTSATYLATRYNGLSLTNILRFKANNATSTNAAIEAQVTNASIVLAPNGSGAILADVPDGSSTGGNARGVNAVDWQVTRTLAASVASGNYATIPGGRDNKASGDYSIATGYASVAGIVGQHAHATGGFAAVGDAQISTYLLRVQTTNNSATEMTSDGLVGTATTRIMLANYQAISFTGYVVATKAGSQEGARFAIKGLVNRGATAGSAVLVGSSVTLEYNDAGAASWTITLTADSGGFLKVAATGETSETIHWVARILTEEVTAA